MHSADETETQSGFSAWDYARQRCSELCEAPEQAPALEVRMSG